MKVRIKTFSFLREKFGDKTEITQDIPDGISVGELLALVGFAAEEISAVYVNKVLAKNGQLLQDGDEIVVLPPISGG